MAEEFPRAWPKEPGVSAGLSISQVSYPGQSLGREDLLEQATATHSSILAWRIPWTEKAGGLWSMGSQRVRHDLATEHAHTSTQSVSEQSQGFATQAMCW